MTEILGGVNEASKFIQSCLDAVIAFNSSAYRSCLSGFVRNADADLVEALINEAERSGQPDHFTALLLCMPFRKTTWRQLDDKPSKIHNSYWRTVEPRTWSASSPQEINESVDRLLTVGRANAAFRAAFVSWESVESSLLIRLLEALPSATSGELLNNVRTDDYNISTAFDELDKRPGLTIEEKARLEFAHIVRLDRSKHGIPNIESHIGESPEAFALVIARVYKRADGGEDSPGFWSGDGEHQQGVARQAQILLNRIRYIPGTDKNGNIDAEELRVWLGAVRSWCERHDRGKIGEQKIGALLAHAPEAEGVWPCRPVCEALQSMESEEVGESFVLGTLNRRGVYMKGKGGDKEREHMERYRSWASELVFEYPYVGGLLERIARYYQYEAGLQDTETEVMRQMSL